MIPLGNLQCCQLLKGEINEIFPLAPKIIFLFFLGVSNEKISD